MADLEKLRELKEIGKRIRDRREEMDLTQEQLAQKSALSKNFISEVEAGRTAASGINYLRIARALETPVQWILTGEELQIADGSSATVSPEVSEIADRYGWSHRRALDVSAIVQTVQARRTTTGRRPSLTEGQIVQIGEAVGGDEQK